MPDFLGIDIGGTKIAAGLVSEDFELLRKNEVPTEHEKGLDRMVQNIVKAAKDLKIEKVDGIGIGMAGQIDRKNGRVVFSPNIPEIKDLRLIEKISSSFKNLFNKGKANIKIDNDANCFALAEHKIGVGKGVENLAMVTVGTGIGGGLIINNELCHGSEFASEIGHMIIKAKGHQCSCGLLGHLEAYSSGTSIEKEYFEKTGQNKKAHEIEISALQVNDQVAKEIYLQAGEYLGIGLASLVNIIDPELIVLGGGIGRSEMIFEQAVKFCHQNTFFRERKTEILQSKLSNEAAIIGAAMVSMPAI